ncbi:predicted protein [Phaeodactylum tricornutum CCAP 1055/1]|uniref:Uncharacterized protein n=1 Tax=Phaeodactylum tricornutum (strain CCAP 1055/1) TaxID=556484 RepID=B7S488_PHATC|nr:predicted protein [Phaeodactylum tricornutum CCAP 1055/1]EEC42643.1 predicted protein [Phaeodactylum tricornutum CCAP 1055/1]|eukprot:XP_002176407.1 predicted protein [Phaeodactylum tricornutum CCAP 1055/1]
MGQSASKEKFRESVTALIQVDVSADDADFWDELWKIPSSAEEVFELLPARSARKLRDDRFENLATLFTQAVAQLCQIVETPYNIYFDQALNCVRVLTRMLPFLLEKGTQSNIYIGLVTSDEQEPLALLVVHAAMHMLFLPQFTCDYYEDSSSTVAQRRRERVETKDDKELKADAGLKVKTVDWGVTLYDKNRIEVLRLVLTACCDPLFSPADEYNPLASRWLAVATAADAPNACCLFFSLLNTILHYDPRGLPVAAGFSENSHVKLVELSAQVLCVLLDCGIPGSPEPVMDQNGNPCVEFEVASRGGFNILRTLLARIDTGKELSMIFDGFARLLRNVYEAESNYIAGVKLECFQELLVLFWKFLEENPLFMPHILKRCNVNEIIVPICFLMYKSRRDPAQIGLVHICTFVLLKLSGERSFGVALNQKFTKKLPTDLPLFRGCHADLLTITLHKLVVNGAYKLVPLYSCFLTIITNISPYWKSMSLVAAVKLVNLFELFASPKFLYSGEFAHRHLALLLEVFNNIIQYQYHGNSHLVYAIVRRKDAFGQIAALTLENAQAQCHKVYGEQTAVKRDIDAHLNVDNKGIPNMVGDDNASASSSVNGVPFLPTADWLEDFKDSMPIETVTRLLQHLVPVVDEIVAQKSGNVDEQEILNVLDEMTMVGLLPVPHPIVIRKYQPNQYTALWFTAFMWGVVFLRNQSLPLFDGECIELFQVSVQDDDDD